MYIIWYTFNMEILLALFYFFYFSVVGVYVIFMPKVLYMLGYSASEVGIIFSAAPLVRFVVPFLFMQGLELNRRVFNGALIILIVSALSFYLSIESFYKLLFSNIFLGVGLSLILPYVELASLEKVGKQHYGKIRLFGSIGFILVALILVKLLSTPTVALNFLFVLTSITAIVAFFIAQKESMQKREKHSGDASINILQDWKLWAGFILMQMSFGSFYNFFTIYSTHNGISLDMTIYLWSFGVIVEIIMLFFQARLLKNNLLTLLQFTTLMTAFRWFLVFEYADNIEMLFFTQSIHALSFALFHSAAISYLFELYKQKSLAQQLFLGLSYGLGALLGALIAGYMYEFYPTYLFASSALMAFAAFLFLRAFSNQCSKKLP